MNKLDEYLDQIYLNEFVIIPTILLGAMIYNKHLSKAAKVCKQYKSKEKQKCMLLYKLKGRKEQLNKISKNISQCSKDKKADKCKERALKEVNKIKSHIKKLIFKLKTLEAQKA